MRKNLSKNTKSAIAFALAAMMAVPTATVLNTPKVVYAEEEEIEIPEPIAVYNFGEDEEFTISQESIENGNAARVAGNEALGKVVAFNDAIAVTATKEAVKTTTMTAADYEAQTEKKYFKDDSYPLTEEEKAQGIIGVTYAAVVADELNSYNINSSIEIKNPFAGMADSLVEEPLDYLESYAPIWETGVTISYWAKTNGKGTEEDTESPMLTFNRTKDNMVHKDDRDKYRLCQLYKENPENPLFKAGTITAYTKDDFPSTYNGKPVEKPTSWVGANKTRYVITDFGVFACMNPNFNPENKALWFFKLDSTGEKYTLEKSSASKIDLTKYDDMTAEGSLIRYGTEKGCLTFMTSGGYTFTETGLVEEVFQGGKLYELKNQSERQFQRNTLQAFTYIKSGNDTIWKSVAVEDEEGEVVSGEYGLVEEAKWHFITYVIKNDSISLYVDGVVQDEYMFTDGEQESKVIPGQSFNRGYGYHNSASDAEMLDIISKSGGVNIFYQLESYLIGGKAAQSDPENIIKDLHANGVEAKSMGYIGYNGNCNADTLMEYITDENTQLFIGEDGPSSAADLMKSEFGTKAGTYISTISFYDVPLVAEQIKAIYDIEKEKNPNDFEDEIPDVDPVSKLKGDADLDGEVDLDDVLMVLKAALKVEAIENEQGVINCTFTEGAELSLDDVLMVLKIALKVITVE